MKAEAIGRKTIKAVNSIVDFMVLLVILLMIAFAFYALWDSKQIYNAADKSRYEVYKPTAEDGGKSFAELQAINPEVIAWLTVYGTNIDYPVTQGTDNMKYVNINAENMYSLSGAIFLDKNNSKDFSDFNSILYGHHMDKKVMFGEIGEFIDINVFNSHQYGNLYVEGKNYGIEFFAFAQVDAYNKEVFTANVSKREQGAYISELLGKAVNKRTAVFTTTPDRIILLATCSAASTNGRDVLVGRITDEVFDDPFVNTEATNGKGQLVVSQSQSGYVKDVPLWLPLLALVIMIRVIVFVVRIWRRRKQCRRAEAV